MQLCSVFSQAPTEYGACNHLSRHLCGVTKPIYLVMVCVVTHPVRKAGAMLQFDAVGAVSDVLVCLFHVLFHVLFKNTF